MDPSADDPPDNVAPPSEDEESGSENEVIANFMRFRQTDPDFPLLPSLELLGVPLREMPPTEEEKYRRHLELEEAAHGLYVSLGGRAPFPFDLVEQVMNNGRQFGAHPDYGDVVAGQWVDGEPIEPRDFVCWSLWARWTQFQLMRKVIRRESVRAETDLFTVVRPLARLVRHLPPPQKEWSSQRFGDWGFDRYALAVRDMARRHGVTEEFRLKQKMKEQDLLSTWVEYFYFEARWFNFWRRFTRSLEREYQDDFQILIDNRVLRDAETPQDVENFDAKLGESEEKRALEGLQTSNATVALLDAKLAQPAATPEESAELQKLLDEAREARADAEKCHWKTRQRNRLVREFLRSTRQHREEHGNMRCMGRFLRWVRAQIAAIAREAAAAGNASEDGSVTPTPEAPNPARRRRARRRRQAQEGGRAGASRTRRGAAPAARTPTDDSSSSSDSGSDASQPASKRRRPRAADGDDEDQPFMRAHRPEDAGQARAGEEEGDGDDDGPKAAARRRLARRLGEVDVVIREDDPFPGAARTITGALGAAYVVVMGRRKRARRKLDTGMGVVYAARLPSVAPSEAEATAGGVRGAAFGGFSPLNGPGGFGARFGPGAAAGSAGPDGGATGKGKERVVHVIIVRRRRRRRRGRDAERPGSPPGRASRPRRRRWRRRPCATPGRRRRRRARRATATGSSASRTRPACWGATGSRRRPWPSGSAGCTARACWGWSRPRPAGRARRSGPASAGGGGVALPLAQAHKPAPASEAGRTPDPAPTSGETITRALMEAMAGKTAGRTNRPQIPAPGWATGSGHGGGVEPRKRFGPGAAHQRRRAGAGPGARRPDPAQPRRRQLHRECAPGGDDARAGPARPPGHPRRCAPGGDGQRAARPPPHAAAAAAAAAGARVHGAGARGGGAPGCASARAAAAAAAAAGTSSAGRLRGGWRGTARPGAGAGAGPAGEAGPAGPTTTATTTSSASRRSRGRTPPATTGPSATGTGRRAGRPAGTAGPTTRWAGRAGRRRRPRMPAGAGGGGRSRGRGRSPCTLSWTTTTNERGKRRWLPLAARGCCELSTQMSVTI